MGDNRTTAFLSAANLNLSEISQSDGSPCYQISGDTHPHRHTFRELGGVWDKMKRIWVFTQSDPAPAIAEHLQNHPAAEQGISDNGQKKPHYWGHRERLRNRFMDSSAKSLPDYELLELLLFQCVERIDVKPLSKDLLADFGSLGAVFAAAPERLAEHEKLTYAGVVHLKALGETQTRVAAEEISKGPILSSWENLIRYLKTALVHAKNERFQILFLNAKNELIADEIQQQGTVNHTPVYPREVIKRALELGATAIIMVYNHPSGDPTPSPADITMTKNLSEAASRLEITVHDHIIMSKHGHTSFRDLGLL